MQKIKCAKINLPTYIIKRERLKLQERISKLKDEDLIKKFTEEELQYLFIGLNALIGVKKIGLPISCWINEHTYKILCRIYIRLNGRSDWLACNTPFIHELEELEKETLKKENNINKDLELWEMEDLPE